ncbi:hypothetical protein [Legionella drozanskii]|uniref:Uncharacterized protein n=1 Tax=Legionella drozanskii LLAP-1 TaxID=1212489 RepID=A0A0W0SQ04_9GAMM|nr:hypothetical protein [Legionella drozanskii]KTC85495.1 hypothetical protein Ldro_2667 [Legionella drozanskii LLAP-1]
MKTRLVWNFEIDSVNLLNLQNLSDSRDEIRWEARYFWPANTIICLKGLDERFLLLSNYAIKHRQDSYALLADKNFNIKHRRMQLLYKPLLQETNLLRGYGKKIDLADFPSNEILPGTKALDAPTLLAEIEKNQIEIQVAKDALVYKLPSEPTIKLELARLIINKQIYFSACVEGRSKTLVSTIAKHLLGEQLSCDYVSFLKQTFALR